MKSNQTALPVTRHNNRPGRRNTQDRHRDHNAPLDPEGRNGLIRDSVGRSFQPCRKADSLNGVFGPGVAWVRRHVPANLYKLIALFRPFGAIQGTLVLIAPRLFLALGGVFAHLNPRYLSSALSGLAVYPVRYALRRAEPEPVFNVLGRGEVAQRLVAPSADDLRLVER